MASSRREREETYCNSRKLCGMDSTLPHLTDSRERLLDSYLGFLNLLTTDFKSG
jgi:hypothetical protein